MIVVMLSWSVFWADMDCGSKVIAPLAYPDGFAQIFHRLCRALHVLGFEGILSRPLKAPWSPCWLLRGGGGSGGIPPVGKMGESSSCPQVAQQVVFILTITALNIGVNQTLPPVSYVKALDVWCFFCLFMVCGALLQCILVSFLAKESQEDQGRSGVGQLDRSPETDRLCQARTCQTIRTDSSAKVHTSFYSKRKWKQTADKIDMFSRVLFPLVYVIFNLIFWVLYLA